METAKGPLVVFAFALKSKRRSTRRWKHPQALMAAGVGLRVTLNGHYASAMRISRSNANAAWGEGKDTFHAEGGMGASHHAN